MSAGSTPGMKTVGGTGNPTYIFEGVSNWDKVRDIARAE